LDKSFTKLSACGARAPKDSMEIGRNLEEQEGRIGEYLETLRDAAYLATVRGASERDKREGEQGWETVKSRMYEQSTRKTRRSGRIEGKWEGST